MYMLRSLIGVLAMALVLFGAAAGANAAVFEGHFKGLPGSIFELTISKVNGKRYVTQIYFNATPVSCEDGKGYNGGYRYPSPPQGRITRNRTFKLEIQYPGDLTRATGELRRGGKAVGTFKDRETLDQPSGVCKTGKLKWVAHRAASPARRGVAPVSRSPG